MLVFLFDQCPVAIIDEIGHRNLARDHGLWFQTSFTQCFDNSGKVLLLVAKHGFEVCFSEDKPVGVEWNAYYQG